MDIRKKFTFEDPEDSYWNQSASTSASIFEDPKDTVVSCLYIDFRSSCITMLSY